MPLLTLYVTLPSLVVLSMGVHQMYLYRLECLVVNVYLLLVRKSSLLLLM